MYELVIIFSINDEFNALFLTPCLQMNTGDSWQLECIRDPAKIHATWEHIDLSHMHAACYASI